ncbi:MAG: thiolase domain-containing protein [bacterium]
MKISVLGVGCTKFAELWDKSLHDLIAQSQFMALDDAGIAPSQIESIFVGNMLAQQFNGQAHLGAIAAQQLGINVPSVRVENACASGSSALVCGVHAILSGAANVVMVIGVEKMSDVAISQATTALMGAGDYQLEHFAGATFPGLFAMVTRLYMQKYGLTSQELAAVSIKNHNNAALNPLAQFNKKITLDDYLNSPVVADPLRLLDCAPISDGAAAIIISNYDLAKKYGKNGVNIIASAQATDTLDLASREEITSFKATKISGKKAFEIAGITQRDIKVAEIHDAFSMAEIIALEDLGFFKQGTAGFETAQGKTQIAGELPVNTSGGLKAKGHPVGASGISQVVEIVNQLLGRCGQRQVQNAKYGLAHNIGGIGTTAVVHIFERE